MKRKILEGVTVGVLIFLISFQSVAVLATIEYFDPDSNANGVVYATVYGGTGKSYIYYTIHSNSNRTVFDVAVEGKAGVRQIWQALTKVTVQITLTDSEMGNIWNEIHTLWTGTVFGGYYDIDYLEEIDRTDYEPGVGTLYCYIAVASYGWDPFSGDASIGAFSELDLPAP